MIDKMQGHSDLRTLSTRTRVFCSYTSVVSWMYDRRASKFPQKYSIALSKRIYRNFPLHVPKNSVSKRLITYGKKHN